MKKAFLLLSLLSIILLSGCTLQDSICIEGKNLTYDGENAGGLLRISVCNDPVVNSSVLINNTTSEEYISQLPLFEGVKSNVTKNQSS